MRVKGAALNRFGASSCSLTSNIIITRQNSRLTSIKPPPQCIMYPSCRLMVISSSQQTGNNEWARFSTTISHRQQLPIINWLTHYRYNYCLHIILSFKCSTCPPACPSQPGRLAITRSHYAGNQLPCPMKRRRRLEIKIKFNSHQWHRFLW